MDSYLTLEKKNVSKFYYSNKRNMRDKKVSNR